MPRTVAWTLAWTLEPIDQNRALWDELVSIHMESDFYDVEGFKRGRTALRHIELEEIGDVSGKSLLHLQCHFGLDTLSLARLGAKVTGADFSAEAIGAARQLARELDIEATFVHGGLYELPEVIDAEFDFVFTSYGALAWLPDVRRWADVVAYFLRPGGTFYMVEFHPIVEAFGGTDTPVLEGTYFHDDEPAEWKCDGTYAKPGAAVSNRSYQWRHPVGDVVSALVESGLTIEFLHEHPRTSGLTATDSRHVNRSTECLRPHCQRSQRFFHGRIADSGHFGRTVAALADHRCKFKAVLKLTEMYLSERPPSGFAKPIPEGLLGRGPFLLNRNCDSSAAPIWSSIAHNVSY